MFSTKTIYNLVCWSLTIFCFALYYALLRYEVLPRSLYHYGFIIMIGAWRVMEGVATKLCQKLGVSQESVKVERFERVAGTHANFVTEPLQYRGVSNSQKKLVFVAGGFFGVAFGIVTLMWLIDPSAHQNMVGIIPAPLGLLFFVVLMPLLVVGSRAPRPLADEQGIYVHTSFLQKTLVLWPKIQHMKIETRHNVLGDLASITIFLQDAGGQEQKIMFLHSLPEATRGKLVYMTTTNANLQQVASLSK